LFITNKALSLSIIKNDIMITLEQEIIKQIKNLPFLGKKLYTNYSDSQIKNLKHFDNILGTCKKGWDVEQTIQNHFY
jgi:hypothetical protein